MNPYSLKAVNFGVSLARKYDAKLHVLHLVTNPVDMIALNPSGLFPEVMYTNYFDNQQDSKERLDIVIKKEIGEGFPINELVSDNDPFEEILKVVSDEKIDLIVMLAHEEGRLEHALFGGENDAIVRRMPCSILLLKEELEPGNLI
jgi:nucleotide-binding universal stress UspA family protein